LRASGEMMSLKDIEGQIKNCKRCELWRSAKSAVPGEGPADARIMFIGEAPGVEEDRSGRPFVGRAGRFLNKIFEKYGIKREELFITSVLKHYTRIPKKKYVKACLSWTLAQIDEIKPKLVVLAGNTAIKAFFKGLSAADSGKVIEANGRKYLICPHPAAAMRFPKQRAKFESAIKVLKTSSRKLNKSAIRIK